jgi:hypothetical protein
LRLEREFQLSKLVVKKSDPECKHFLRPVEFVRLPSKAGEEQLVASIFEAPGPNYLKDMVTFGPNWFTVTNRENSWQSHVSLPNLLDFFDFAIGSVECLEVTRPQYKLSVVT